EEAFPDFCTTQSSPTPPLPVQSVLFWRTRGRARRGSREGERGLGGFVGLERWAGAHEVAIAVGVVDAGDRRPELVLAQPGGREGGLGARVGVRPLPLAQVA